MIFPMQLSEFTKSLNLQTLQIFIFHLQINFHRHIHIFSILNKIYPDRSELDFSDEEFKKIYNSPTSRQL